MASTTTLDAFLLTRDHKDHQAGLQLEFWAASPDGPVRIIMPNQEAVFFAKKDTDVKADRTVASDLLTLDGSPAQACYFQHQHSLLRERRRLMDQGVTIYESGITPTDRFLMERFITAPMTITGSPVQQDGFLEFTSPQLRPSQFRPHLSVASLDIETEGLDGAIYSVAIATANSEKVFMVGTGSNSELVEFHPDERSLLEHSFAYLQAVDPDIIIGWNVIDFDLRFLACVCERLDITFAIGRNSETADTPNPTNRNKNPMPHVPGRSVLDGIASLRGATYQLEDYSLEAVGQKLLGRGKLIHTGDRVEEINRLYREAPEELAAYNIEDCRLVLDIFDHTQLLEFEIERASLNGLPLGRQGGSVAAFD